jgi:hypothetical protein
MTALHTLDAPMVRASVTYTVRTGSKPVSETGGADGMLRNYAGQFARHEVEITDGRRAGGPYGLETSGFELADHPTRMRDFYDPDELRAVYYPEMQRLIAERSGAVRVEIFDHTLRTSDEDARAKRKIREPVKVTHNDYTHWSGPQRLRDILPHEAEALLGRRMAIVQTWRAINRTIERHPLAMIDARSIAPADLIAAERRFPDRVGEIYHLDYNPAHRWTYFPHMRRDEALVFKVYDSDERGRARWCPHTSFDDPTTPPGAPPRESIEIRAFAFF